MQEVNSRPSGKLLEIGVGTGTHLKEYEQHAITGIDNSAGMLNRAALQRPAAVELLLMDGELLLFPADYFDYVVLSHVVAVANDPEQLIREVYRVLKPGGEIFILNHFTPDNWLRYLDKAFQPLARRLHFKSLFQIDNIGPIKKFQLIRQICFGWYGYFKLLIYRKP